MAVSAHEAGVTLVETLAAIAILGVIVTGVMAAMVAHTDTNTLNEVRTGAGIAAVQVLESLRLEDPETLPAAGASAPVLVTLQGRDYEVVTHYCERPEHCSPTSRHVRAEVLLDGRQVFDAETVFTQVR